MEEQEAIKKALTLFEERTGLTLKQARRGIPQNADALLTLKAKNITRQFAAVYKKYLNDNHALGIVALNMMGNLPIKGILIADYINPAVAKRLQEMDIPFLDGAGNMFLNETPIYIFITGNKPQHKITQRTPKPFHAATLKVLFALLCRPDLITKTLRELARHTGVALGTVGNVMEDLRIRRHIVATADGTPHLVNLKPLLQMWVMLYPTVLRPKLFLGRYAALGENQFDKAELPAGMIWGGEVAAGKLTNYLKAESLTIYTHDKVAPLLVKNRLKEDPGGKIEVLKTFWDQNLKLEKSGVAPSLLVYADLLATKDPRNIETAQMIYEQELVRHIEG